MFSTDRLCIIFFDYLRERPHNTYAIFRDFWPPPPFVTQNRTNPYMFTVERNKSLTPPKCVRIMWTFPNLISNLSHFYSEQCSQQLKKKRFGTFEPVLISSLKWLFCRFRFRSNTKFQNSYKIVPHESLIKSFQSKKSNKCPTRANYQSTHRKANDLIIISIKKALKIIQKSPNFFLKWKWLFEIQYFKLCWKIKKNKNSYPDHLNIFYSFPWFDFNFKLYDIFLLGQFSFIKLNFIFLSFDWIWSRSFSFLFWLVFFMEIIFIPINR